MLMIYVKKILANDLPTGKQFAIPAYVADPLFDVDTMSGGWERKITLRFINTDPTHPEWDNLEITPSLYPYPGRSEARLTVEINNLLRETLGAQNNDILVILQGATNTDYSFRIVRQDDAERYEIYSQFFEDAKYARSRAGGHALVTTDDIEQIAGKIEPGYNKLIYGAPGTSKSWTVDEKIVNGQKSFRITFHPDTDYAAFVGCYKPETIDVVEDGKVITKVGYGFHKQVFLEAYVEAWKLLPEGRKVFLVIEEINRGNCAQIFGDIFQLLDRRKDGYSKYTINADTDISRILKGIPGYKENFIAAYPDKADDWADNLMALPTNLNIIATMNTSDQSLFQMDSAFKRRWDQEYFPIKYSDANKANLDLGEGNVFKWGDVLQVLNDYIKQQTESANKTIGNRFIDFERTANVIAYKTFRDKVLFYLFTDVFKDNLDFAKDFYGDAFDNDHQFFEDLCENEDPAIAVAFIRKIDTKGILPAPVVKVEEAPVEEAPVAEE